MSQRLRTMTKKDGSAKGVAIRKTNATKSPTMLATLIKYSYNENQRNKKNNGTSKKKTA